MTLGLPLGPKVFTIHVAAALAQEPDIEIADQKTLTIELRVQGARLTINLDNLYLQYQRAPSALDEQNSLASSPIDDKIDQESRGASSR